MDTKDEETKTTGIKTILMSTQRGHFGIVLRQYGRMNVTKETMRGQRNRRGHDQIRGKAIPRNYPE